jgi:hypothetical protein
VNDGLVRLVLAALGIGLIENIALIASGPSSSTLLQVTLLFGMILIALLLHIAPFIFVVIGRTIIGLDHPDGAAGAG